MINRIKRDFMSVRIGVCMLFNREVPLGLCILWYIIFTPLGLIMLPFVKLRLRQLLGKEGYKEYKKAMKEAAKA